MVIRIATVRELAKYGHNPSTITGVLRDQGYSLDPSHYLLHYSTDKLDNFRHMKQPNIPGLVWYAGIQIAGADAIEERLAQTPKGSIEALMEVMQKYAGFDDALVLVSSQGLKRVERVSEILGYGTEKVIKELS